MALTILYFFFTFCYTVAQQNYLNTSDLNMIETIQNMFCITDNKCSHQTNILSIHLQVNETLAMLQSIDLPIYPPSLPSFECCGKCSCDIESCEVRDSCCIEALEELWPRTNSKPTMFCDYPQLRSYNEDYANTDVPILALRECPKQNIVDIEIISKCEQSNNYQDIDTKIPVTDNATMFIYKNRYCAFCHNVTEATLHYWDVTLECLRGILKPRDINSVVSEVLDSETCNLIYSRPAPLISREPFFRCRKVISQCNATGHWKTYNSFVENACLAYTTIYNFKYRNVFCYLCNTKDIIGLNRCTGTSKPIVFVKFKALLTFKPEKIPSFSDPTLLSRCQGNQMYDPLKRQCRDVECLFPKSFHNMSCENLVENLGGLTYGIYYKLIPLDEPDSDYFPALHTTASDIKGKIYAFIHELIPYDFLFSFNLYLKMQHVSEEIPLTTSNNISYFVVYVEVDCHRRYVVKSDIVGKLLSFHDTILSTNNNGTEDKYYVELDMYQKDSMIYDQFNKSVDDLIPILTETLSSRFPLTILSLPYIYPSVRLFSNKFNIVRSTESIFIEEYNITININEVLIETLTNGNNISVRMCISKFKQIVQQLSSIAEYQESACATEIYSVETILTFVCTTLSICFSIVTIVIYLKFKKFKNQPGVNNIILCLSLILSQSLYQFGSGQSCQVSKLSCKVIGIFVHFSWLFLMFWMNICCIHMFRVFKLHQTKMAVFNVTKTTMLYVAYSLSCSLVLIMINVIVSLIKSDGSDIGYGGSLCYISEGQMIAYLFALPVALIVVFNIVLFIVVVLQMKNTAKVQNNTKRQQFLHIYAKLSTLTGGTWVVGFCSYFLNIAVLDYIFIILNASQGVFLFFAFVANWGTLKALFRRKRSGNTTDKNQFSDIGGNTGSFTLSK